MQARVKEDMMLLWCGGLASLQDVVDVVTRDYPPTTVGNEVRQHDICGEWYRGKLSSTYFLPLVVLWYSTMFLYILGKKHTQTSPVFVRPDAARHNMLHHHPRILAA